MDVDRLALVAEEFAVRVRDEGPAENQRWLQDMLPDPAERDALPYALAAMVPLARSGRPDTRRLLAWTEPPPDPTHVDEIAVERACYGDPVRLNQAERAVAIAKLVRRGLTSKAIERILHVSSRTVQRHKPKEKGSASGQPGREVA